MCADSGASAVPNFLCDRDSERRKRFRPDRNSDVYKRQEWTSTKFAPFPGFKPFPFYRGYSADFFDGKHFVMKGGSSRTAAGMLRGTFRNWFQAHYQYIYTGFRCVSR